MDNDLDIVADKSCDLTSFQCPMNLVMAKNFFFNITQGSYNFVLKTENKAGINNIINFLKFKNASQIKVVNNQTQKITYIYFEKNIDEHSLKKSTTPASTPIINSEKKTNLAKRLQQNIKRRKS